MQAEADAVNLLAGAKTQSNPENSVGVLCLAGKVPRVLVTPTDDLGQVLNSVHGISVEGAVNLPTGVQVSSGICPGALQPFRRHFRRCFTTSSFSLMDQ